MKLIKTPSYVRKHKITHTTFIVIFSLIAVFGLSLLTGNNQQSNIGSSSASALEPADINNDNTVNVFDLSYLLGKWNTNDATADLNKDGIVNVFDLSYLLGKWNTTTTTTAAMPTRDNTGPRYALTDMTVSQFYSTRNCNRQRINGDISIDQASMRGQTFTITDCEITGSIFVYLIGGNQQLPAAQMPVVNISYSDVLSGIAGENAFKLTIDHSYVGDKVQLKLSDGWPINVLGYAPYVFTNSLLYNRYATQPTHTETLQTAGLGTDTRFTNVVFMQQGGSINNTGVTAVINYQGSGTIFDGCYFLWDGEPPAWYTVYISGQNVVVKNSWFDGAYGGANYVYPHSADIMPTFTNNRNYRTNQLLNLP